MAIKSAEAWLQEEKDKEWAEESAKLFQEIPPGETRKKVLALLAEVLNTQQTSQCFYLAHELRSIFKLDLYLR